MRSGSGRWFKCRFWRVGLAAVTGCLIAGGGCSRYSQDTPAATLASARKMVQEGHAERLQTLIYAENPQFRKVWKQLGVLLGHIQDLGRTINEKFPTEVAELRREAEAAAASGEASSMLGRAMMGQLGGGRRQGAGDPQAARESLDRAFKELFADPYGWLERSGDRLSTVTIADDAAAVLWDNQPILPPIGLSMQESGGKWYFLLPTNLPGVSNVMPRTDDEYAIWVQVVRVLDRVIIDIENEVKSGKVKDLRALSESAGEKAFVPMALGLLAYGKAMEAREREAKAATTPAPVGGG